MEQSTKKHIITIAGELGSGKSSTAKLVASKLRYIHYSAGDLMRQIGREQGIEDIRTFNFSIEGKVDFDHQVDERTKKIGLEQDRVVFDGHMAGHMLPQSFRVYLTLPANVAAERILSSITPERRASEHIPDDPLEYLDMLNERQQSNIRRYMKLYGVNPYQPKLYDLVVDTSKLSLEEVADRVVETFWEWYQK